MDENTNDDSLGFLCRHLVSFGWIDWTVNNNGGRTGEPRVHCQSGFMMSFRGVWMLATAGHVIQDMETLFSDPRVHVEGGCLLDGWSLGAINHDPVPFDILDTPKVYHYSEADGLDYGFILIRPLFRRLLEMNGIEAVAEQDWRNLYKVNFTHYGLLGIPEERVTMNLRRTVSGTHVSSTADPIYLPITWVDNPPSELTQTTCPRFIGRLPSGFPLNSIVGMSGGPVFGFAEENGSWKYWIVAIQSMWRKDLKIILGCLLPYVGTLVERDLDELAQMNQNDTKESATDRAEKVTS